MGKQISRFILIGLVTLLFGCGGGNGQNGPAPTQQSATQTPVTTPNAFSFTDQSGMALSSSVVSNEITISGIDASAPVSIDKGEYSVDGGSFTAANGSVSNNQKIKLRLISSSQFSTAVSAVLTVGGVSGAFTVTTLNKDTTPNAFQFQRQVNAIRSTWVASNSVTISDINAPALISIENGEYSIDGGAFTSATGLINPAQSLIVRVNASSIYSRITGARVTIGSVSADFEVTSELPNYAPNEVVYDDQDIIYLLDNNDKLIFRWSIIEERYLDSYVIGLGALAPSMMSYSSDHKRLYLGYSTGAIQSIDVTAASPAEVPFANTALGVGGLVAVGKYVLAEDGSGAWATHYVFDRNGVVTDQKDWNYYSREYAWDAVTSRVYFFRDDTSPNDLHYEVIDQVTGKITSEGETPYHGSYNIQPPIRVSVNGQYILLGSGDIYNQTGLTWSGSLGSQVTDARWFTNGSSVTLTTASTKTTLRRLGASLTNLEQLSFDGQALRVVGSDAKMAVLVIKNSTVQFYSYVPNDDSDGDGVVNTQDAFPLDPAASVDTDRDGYPDAWNSGKSQSDSTTGLTLDAYPNDAGCYLPSDGDGVNCNYAAHIPNYVPDQVINEGDTVYLLSSANKRVYRWSIATAGYLNPYAVGINQGFSTLAPSMMSYSSDHKRLYLGYSTGAIQSIDVTAASPAEVPFANTALGVGGLVAVGKYVLAEDGSGAWATHYVFDRNGVVTDQKDWNYYSREYAWDAVTSRVYFFRDSQSPNDLHYEVIDQVTGKITAEGETPYHGDYSIAPPIRVSVNGQYILLGSGDIYNQTGLTWSATLGKAVKDANWKDNVLVDVDNTDLVEIRDKTTLAVLANYQYLGQPIRLVFGQADVYLLHVVNGGTAFLKLAFGDQDQDSLPKWWEQLYGLSDSIPSDALGDLDSDGVSNSAEYLNHSNPLVADSDSDGLTDYQEIVTYFTNPTKADSDGDGLSDSDEVLTSHSDPWKMDTDSDGYSDLIEVQYGGNPNDATVLPKAIVNFSESFENNPSLVGWSIPSQSSSSWTIDSASAFSGTKSLKSGAIGNSQSSRIVFRALFSTGQLSFYTKVDSESCCDRLNLLVDGVQVLSVSAISTWTQMSVPLTLGLHDVEWRYQKDGSAAQGADAAWIDDVVFVKQ